MIVNRNKYNTIPINRPDIPNLSFEDYRVTNSSISDFEDRFRNWLGKGIDVVMTSSGKMATYLLFKALGLKGNIISSPLSCNMAFIPVIANGISIKFADINPETFLINEDKIEELIDSETRAIYVIHLGGFIPDMYKIRDIADRYNLLVIEDCAQSLGSHYDLQKAGNFGDYSCFSFAKNIWGVGGGAICSKNHDVLKKIKHIQNKLPEISIGLLKYRYNRDLLESRRGLIESSNREYYEKFILPANNANVGIDYKIYFKNKDVNCKPSNRQAAIIDYQFNGIDQRNIKRHGNALKIIKKLETKYSFQMNDNCFSIYSKLYCYPYSDSSNDTLIPLLFGKGIDVKHLTKSHGIHLQERVDKNPSFVNTCKNLKNLSFYRVIHDKIIAIPISSHLLDEEINYITETLNNLYYE